MKKKKMIGAFAIFFAIAIIIALAIKIFFNIPQTTKIEVPDGCGIVLGNLVHTISSQDECEGRCAPACIAADKKFIRASYLEKGNRNGCNSCYCVCR